MLRTPLTQASVHRTLLLETFTSIESCWLSRRTHFSRLRPQMRSERRHACEGRASWAWGLVSWGKPEEEMLHRSKSVEHSHDKPWGGIWSELKPKVPVLLSASADVGCTNRVPCRSWRSEGMTTWTKLRSYSHSHNETRPAEPKRRLASSTSPK